MGDSRFEALYAKVAHASDRMEAIRKLADEEIIAAIAGASRGGDPLLANILATEALNRLHRATAIARDLGDGVLATDPDLRVTFVNPAAEALLNVLAREILGKTTHEVLHPDRQACARGPDGACLLDAGLRQPPAGSHLETTVTRPDAAPVPVLLTLSTVPAGPGDGRIILIRDVTDQARAAALQAERILLMEGSIQRSLDEIAQRKNVEARLRESEERLACIVDTLTEGIVLLDRAGQIMFWNHAAETITGRSAEEVIGQDYHISDYQVTAADGGPLSLDAAFESLLSRGEHVKAVEIRFTTPEGATRIVSADASPLGGDGGGAIVASFNDITSRKRAEEDLVALNRQLEARVQARTAELVALNRELETFAYTVSHDLKAPARGVELLSSAILEDHGDTLGDDAKHQLGRVAAEARRMREIIEDILKLTRLSTRDITRRRVDLTAMARRVLRDLGERQPSRHVEVVVEDALEVTGDPELLQPLIENLLDNAWKYTKLTQDARIRVGRAPSGANEDTIFIQDNGVGFDMAKAGRLFQPFQRLPSASQFEGTGIGLATVRRIVERHGGRVWANAKPGEGATFSFTLPKGGPGGFTPQSRLHSGVPPTDGK
ncbi:MAG: PAS domain-containing protein [Candidatus Thermoplasmatota archaeon]